MLLGEIRDEGGIVLGVCEETYGHKGVIRFDINGDIYTHR